MANYLPATARAIGRAIDQTLVSPEWLAASGNDTLRTWLLTKAVCEALAAAGVAGVPGAAALDDLVQRVVRDGQIQADFNGRNYRELAQQHKLSARTVRRIIERGRQRARQPNL